MYECDSVSGGSVHGNNVQVVLSAAVVYGSHLAWRIILFAAIRIGDTICPERLEFGKNFLIKSNSSMRNFCSFAPISE